MWRDQAYLLDMLTAARDARDFTAGLTRDGYEASRLAQYAVSHALQIIGEAAARVSDDTRNSVGDVPWAQLIGLRIDSSTIMDASIATSCGTRCKQIFRH